MASAPKGLLPQSETKRCVKSQNTEHTVRTGVCREPTVSDDCEVLSLEENFFRRFNFDEFSEDVKGHFCREEWICEFLKENYRRLRKDHDIDRLQDKEIFERIGFKANGAAVNRLLDRLTALNGHQHILDLAKSYVMDEYKYNPKLSKGPHPRFPSFPDRLEGISIINLERRPTTPYLWEIIRRHVHQRTENGRQTVLLFHGTNHKSAESIITSGISVHEGAHKRDFSSGRGFYLTNDLGHSLDWAFNTTRKPAVLVYRADDSERQSFQGCLLAGLNKENEWKDHVKQYQSGEPSKKLRDDMKKFDYVEGPRSARYDPVDPKPEHNTYQLCILSSELAQTMDKFLHSAVFFGGD